MIATNYSKARQNFKEYCDLANNDFETIIVTRKQGGNIVMISEAEYNNLMENIFVMGNKANYQHIMKSIEQLEKGHAKKRELIEVETDE